MKLKEAIEELHRITGSEFYKDFLKRVIEQHNLVRSLRQNTLNIPIKVVYVSPCLPVTTGVIKSLDESPTPQVIERLKAQNPDKPIEARIGANVMIGKLSTIYHIPLSLNGELVDGAGIHYGHNVFYILPNDFELSEGTDTDPELDYIKERLSGVKGSDLESIERIAGIMMDYVNRRKKDL